MSRRVAVSAQRCVPGRHTTPTKDYAGNTMSGDEIGVTTHPMRIRQDFIARMTALDKVVGRRLLMMDAVLAVLLVVSAIGTTIANSAQSAVDFQQEAVGRVAIIGVGPNATGDRIDAWVKNVGVAPINAIDESEIFVITAGARFDAMKYGAAGGDNTWVEDPVGSSWDPRDTLHIVMTLPAGDPLAVGEHVLRVFPPNGITVEKTFTR